MPLPVSGQVGEQTLSDGVTTQPLRQGKLSDVIVSELNGRYYENIYRGRGWLAAAQAAVATSLLSATATGFILSNPAGSGKNLVILDASIAIASLPAGAATLVWAANVNPVAAAVVHTTPLTVRNALLGAAGTSVGLADSAATLPAAPVVVRAIPGGPAATVAGSTAWPPFIRDEVAGALVVTPGATVSIQSLTTAISVLASVLWVEVPV